ncbi:ABC transporter ATP binding protein [Methanocella paludicola SANAE]|uniref:ABC transporter ATP binding protein n=1 Tax=Methanocella paludicola (strain DSM 17711 / JCM 13418 / NBRC 101707 / SANAE) TaxID=304371 RepID=D1Z1Y3_METPS|nr:ATP-binding cassette domain-containing protein [Methanocella paludicola]BAI62705.1 ABC transporter ATP binding protein [Methanocella paludicola SANAE]
MAHIIETRDLTRKFGSLTAVDNISFDVESGEIFGLLGPNGAGKSTTISMLCTILRPTSGTATVNGFDVVKQPSQVRKSIGIVFQDPSIDDKLTGRENLAMHGDLYGVPRSEMGKRIDEVLKLVELEDRQHDFMSTYSSGMRRRLEIARSLIHYPKVLFLDEPTIGLDPQSRDHIWSYIRELIKKENITIILTTHYMEEADKLCGRIAIVDHGKIVALDTPKKLKEELGGETITLKTRNNVLFLEKVKEAGIARSAVIAGEEVKLTVENAHTLLPRVINIAAEHKVYIESISVQEPQLDDVFLHYTGRALRDSKGKEMSAMMRMRRRP